MVQMILCITPSGGIGYKGSLPWNIPKELKVFREKTMNKHLIVGRKTFETLPVLKNRSIGVISRNNQKFILVRDNTYYVNAVHEHQCALEEMVSYFLHSVTHDDIFIAGGKQIYELALSKKDYVSKIHLSVLKKEYECDTFIDLKMFKDFIISERTEHEEFNHYVLERGFTEERQYLNLLEKIVDTGSLVRGRNGFTKSVFGEMFKFDLTKGFPLLTTKKMFLRGVVEELLFFIRGETNSKILEEKNVNIWKGNTSRQFLNSIGFDSRPEGIMGPLYGYNWRYYGSDYDDIIGKSINPTEGVDQLRELIDLIKIDPHSRRLLISTYNPKQAKEGVLFPCHSLILQFYVDDKGYLDMIAYSRSADMFLGIPFNIASYSLFLMIIAKCTGLIARNLTITIGDAHIYEEHFDVVKEQLCRVPFKFPTLSIKKTLKTIEDIEALEFTDFNLEKYNYHDSIKATMIP